MKDELKITFVSIERRRQFEYDVPRSDELTPQPYVTHKF